MKAEAYRDFESYLPPKKGDDFKYTSLCATEYHLVGTKSRKFALRQDITRIQAREILLFARSDNVFSRIAPVLNSVISPLVGLEINEDSCSVKIGLGFIQ